MAKTTTTFKPLRIVQELSNMEIRDPKTGHTKRRNLLEEFERAEASATKKPDCIDELTQISVEYGSAYAWYYLDKKYGLKEGMQVSERCKDGIVSVSYDFTIATFLFAHWRHNKQVYVFDKLFYDMLADMEDFDLEWSILNYLPFKNFYIEVKDHPQIEGILVEHSPKDPAIAYAICFKDNCKLCVTGINGGLIDPRESSSFKAFFEGEIKLSNADLNDPYVQLVRQVLTFMMQACMYLCSKEPDIAEDPKQAKIYRAPKERIKDRYAEIQKWNVGVHVTYEHQRQREENEAQLESLTASGRRRPRQHWRKAHWHTYWVGQGRQKKELKFIAPILVNDIDSGEDENLPVFERKRH